MVRKAVADSTQRRLFRVTDCSASQHDPDQKSRCARGCSHRIKALVLSCAGRSRNAESLVSEWNLGTDPWPLCKL